MYQRLRLWFSKNRTWIYLVQYIFYSILLLIVVGMIDSNFLEVQEFLPRFLLLKVGLSRTLLTTLAGAFLTITTFTFSTILTVVNQYSSEHSPRVVENFVREKITMKVLGIFVGGFVYSICALLLMRDAYADRYVIAGGVAIVYSLVAIFYFVIFVQRVLSSLQGSNIVQDVYADALPVIKEEVKAREESIHFHEEKKEFRRMLYANETGYLSVIDFDRLSYMTKGLNGFLRIDVKLGEFIVSGFRLGELFLDEDPNWDEEEGSEKMKSLADCFLTQEEKFQAEDYRYNISKLVEMCLRSMSSSSIDPNTTIHCIRKISLLMGRLLRSEHHHITKVDREGFKVFYTSYDAEEELYHTYNEILHYGKDDPAVMIALIDGLYVIYKMCDPYNQSEVREYATHVYETSKESLSDKFDLEVLEQSYHKFAKSKKDEVNKEVMEQAEKEEEEASQKE